MEAVLSFGSCHSQLLYHDGLWKEGLWRESLWREGLWREGMWRVLSDGEGKVLEEEGLVAMRCGLDLWGWV